MNKLGTFFLGVATGVGGVFGCAYLAIKNEEQKTKAITYDGTSIDVEDVETESNNAGDTNNETAEPVDNSEINKLGKTEIEEKE